MMKRKLFGLIFILFFVLTIAVAWIWWNAPARVEMARYVPAETLVYFEVNDLPQILREFADTAAWRALAPQYGIENNFGEFGFWSRFLANANLGSTDTIVFGRSQAAIAVFGFETADGGEALRIKPRYAVVLETKSGRGREFIDRRIGELARNQFGDTKIEKPTRDDAAWTIFSSTADERKIFAAARSSVVVFGNDETAVKACLEAQNNKRKTLAENPQLAEMRRAVEAESGFAFGLVTSGGIKQMSRLGSTFLAAQMTEEPAAFSLVAQSLPPMIEKSVNGIGWSARAVEGKIEDCYFVEFSADLASRFREPFAVSNNNSSPRAAEFLPTGAHSITVYNLKNAGAAWRALILGFSSKLDALGAAALAQTSGKLLEPYGAARANDFLSAAGDEIATARLSAQENETVAIVEVADENKIKAALDANAPERAAEFVDGMLLLGEKDDVERCLAAKRSQQNLANTGIWREFSSTQMASSDVPVVKTLTRDAASAAQFLTVFANEKNKNVNPTFNSNDGWIYSISGTRLRESGFERRTRSAFGMLGMLAAAFADTN